VEGNPFSKVSGFVFEDRANRELSAVSPEYQVANAREQRHRQVSDRS
jgi:hypothetical protein